MSNIALSWAFKCHVGNASAKAVLVYLADRADDDGTAAYPKIATIVNVTELSERTVRAALKTLQERGFIRRGDQRYARLGKGGRNRLPQYCQVVWDLAVESDPSTLTWIRETHTAEQDPATMGGTVDPMASTIVENGESKDVLPENVGTKPISSTANLAGLENDSETALQIPQSQHCESCTPSTANPAGPALQISQGCIYKDKTLQVNPPSKPSFPSAPTGHLPASGATPDDEDDGLVFPDAGPEARPTVSVDLDFPTDPEPESESEPAPAADDVARVLDVLDKLRRERGLGVARRTSRDVLAVERLLRDADVPVANLVADLTAAFADQARPWWAKRIRSGRDLARHYAAMRDELTLDRQARKARADAGTRTAEPACDRCAEAHSPDCEHVRRIVNSPEARDLEPHQSERIRFAAVIARELNEHRGEGPTKTAYFASLRLRELLQARHDEIADQAAREQAEQEGKRKALQAELHRLREANGGTMVGYKPGPDVEAAS